MRVAATNDRGTGAQSHTSRELAASEFALDQRTARSVVSILLTGVESLVGQVRSKSTAEDFQFLEDTYVDATLGALSRLASVAP